MSGAIANTGQVIRESDFVHDSPARRTSADTRAVVAALVVGISIVVGMGLGATLLTALAAVAAIVLALVAPAVGVATIAFMGSLQPPLVIPAPGFNAILVGAAALGCVYRLPIDRPRLRVTAPVLLLAGFVLYVAVQQTPEMVAAYAGDLGYRVYSNFRELLTGFVFVLVAAFVLAGRSPIPFLGVGLASATLSAIVGLVTFGDAAVGPPIAGLLAHAVVGDRAVGTFGNPNYFGVFQAIAATTAVGLMIGTKSPRLRLLLLIVSLVLGASLAASLSRGGMFACAAGIACFAFSLSRTRAALLTVAGLLFAALVLFPIFLEWRLTTLEGSAAASSYAVLAESDAGRLAAFLAGPQLFMTAPVFGIGWGHFAAMSTQFIGPGVSLVAHNWYSSVLAEEGLMGIALWTLLIGTSGIALRSRPAFPRSIGVGVLGAYVVGCLSLEAPISFQTSMLAILVIVAAICSKWPSSFGIDRRSTSEVLPSTGSEAPSYSGILPSA